jgi:hypothetical protein
MLNAYSPPNHSQIIQAISRRDGIRVVSDNIVYANGLGLTNAVPAKLTYLTDGPSKIVKIGGWSLRMKHVSPGFMRNATSKSGALFQALTWLGKDVAKTSIDLPLIIKSRVQDDVWLDVQKRSRSFPVWMKLVIDSIAKNNVYA